MILTRIRHLTLLVVFILPACAAVQEKELIWPKELPAHDYFLNIYRQDSTNAKLQPVDQYMLWVMRFYQGSELYPNGWDNVTQDLLLRIKEPELAIEIKNKMEHLGLLISGEWAKNNKTRLITSQHVSIWGNALLRSLEQGETLDILERVAADVDDLMSNKISADVITENRFYAVEEDIFKEIN